MNSERDPQLEALFADAPKVTATSDFTDKVINSVATRRRSILFGRIAILAMIVLLEMLLSAPLQNTVGAMVDALSAPLINLTQPILAMILTPVNSVAGVLGVVLISVHFLYRKVLR